MARGTAVLEDAPLPGLDDLDHDPAPATPKRRPGRPRGSGTAARSTGTRGKIPTRNAKGQIVSAAQMMDKVEGEIYTYLVLLQAGYELRDPDCAAAWAEPLDDGRDRLAELAKRTTALLARSDKILAIAYETGIVGEIIQILMLLIAPLKAMWRAHGPNGTGHSREALSGDYDGFPAYAPAG